MERLREAIEIHKEKAPEEVEEKLIFVWFFVGVIIIMTLIGSFLIIESLADQMPLKDFNEKQVKQAKSGMRSVFGIVLACMGLIVSMLSIFDSYWEDRYLVVGIGLVMIILGIIIFLWLSGAPGIISGLMLLGLALIYGIYVGIVNAFGWLKLRRHKFTVFFSVVMLCLIFVLAIGSYVFNNPQIFIR